MRFEDSKPGYSKTPVGDTEKPALNIGYPQQNQAVIDWLEFTTFLKTDSETVFKFLGLKGKPETAPKGMLGYKKRQQIGAAIVLSDGAENMGIHVIVPPKAMAELGIDPLVILQKIAFINSAGWSSGNGSRMMVKAFPGGPLQWMNLNERGDYFSGCREVDNTPAGERIKLTRLDLALDDIRADDPDQTGGALKLKKLAAALKRGNCVSKMHSYGIIETGSIKTGQTAGRTLYIGKRESNSMIRFYDKRQEQIAANGGNVPPGLPDVWNRAELELKAHSAVNAAALLTSEAHDVGELARGLLNRLFSVRVRPGGDSNKSRWKVAPWWSAYLATLDKIMVGRQMIKPDIDSRRRWFIKQAGPSFVMMLNAYGADDMQSIYTACRSRLNDKQQAEVKKKKAARDLETRRFLDLAENEISGDSRGKSLKTVKQ